MNKTDISWCDYTWNPVTGCKRGCEYCYARKIHNRFNKTPFSDIVFHPERLKDPAKIKKPSTIFVGSMSDCQYWNLNVWENVLYVCNKQCHHTYMFLSKNPLSYGTPSAMCGFGPNTMQGLTVEQPGSAFDFGKIEKMVIFTRPFLSIEPIAGGLYKELPSKIELVIVGAETGNRKDKIIPQKSWIQSIINNVPAEKIHWKPNILPYIKEYGIEVKGQLT